MKQAVLTALLVGSLLLLLLLAGCSDDESPTSLTEDTDVAIETVTPADGATGVSPATAITIKFTGPVDTLSIMSNFHLAGGEGMHEWRDSLDHYGGFGMMGMGHTDHMTAWMDSIHFGGEFHWNEALDSCEFRPDSAMFPATDYLCLLNEGGMRGHRGGMMGGRDHHDSGYHMFGFSTAPGAAGVPGLESVWPADGANNVSRNPIITLSFDMPMDTHSVRSNFHFSGGAEMHEWLDSLDHHQGMGGMGMIDMGHMMDWLADFEDGGQFDWNAAMDSCQFRPDSTLMSDADYLIYLYGDVHAHDGGMMDMHHLEYDGHMIRFRTGP